jgi:hypothetical protein
MKQLKRSECAILPLVLKGKWYDMIASGEKKEEYREAKLFWRKRIRNVFNKAHTGCDKLIVVAFSRGYKKQDMFFVSKSFILVRNEGEWRRRKIEWGEPDTPHYIIGLGERVELVD